MTHNDFDYHDDIIQPLQDFLISVKFDTAPNEVIEEVKFKE
jgi:hypothetical protein